MVLDSRITWEKLSLELELLQKEEPRTLIPLLIGINSLLKMDDSQDWCLRTVNFMTYELAAMCEGKNEADRFEILNEFLFRGREFRIQNLNRKCATVEDLLIKQVLEQRGGGLIPTALLYIHLANQLDLMLFVLNQPAFHILKWSRGSKSSFIDLTQEGKILDEEELLRVLSSCGGAQLKGPDGNGRSESISFRELLVCYLHDLRAAYRRIGELDLCHAVLSMILKIEPTNLKYLGERALMRKEMGHIKEAQQDLKRYFSFTDVSNAPADIQLASRELSAMTSPSSSSDAVH